MIDGHGLSPSGREATEQWELVSGLAAAGADLGNQALLLSSDSKRRWKAGFLKKYENS